MRSLEAILHEVDDVVVRLARLGRDAVVERADLTQRHRELQAEAAEVRRRSTPRPAAVRPARPA